MTYFIKRYQVLLVSIILCLLSLHLALAGKMGMGVDVLINRMLSVVAAPLQTAALHVSRSVDGILDDYIFLVGLKHENEALAQRISTLMEQNQRLREDLKLSGRLQELGSFRERASFDTVTAEILGFHTGGWTKTLTLDKGRVDGISEDMAVIDPRGVVGRIIETTTHTSKALILADPRSSIDVIVQRTRVRGVVDGNSAEGLTLKYVRQLDDVRLGDRIITAGLAGIFPKGLLIGEVVKAEKGSDNFFKDIEVRPVVDLKRLEEVLVVTTPRSP